MNELCRTSGEGEEGEGGKSDEISFVIKSLTYLIRKHIKTVIIIMRAINTMANITERTITTFSSFLVGSVGNEI